MCCAQGWALAVRGASFGGEVCVDVILTDFLNRPGCVLLVSGKDAHTIRTLAPSRYGTTGFGSSVAVLDDVDVDGYADLLVGDIWFGTSTYVGPGAAFVVSGKSGKVIRAHLAPSRSMGGVGASVTRLGDLDRDGIGDYAIGATGYRQNNVSVGACLVFSGRTGKQLRTIFGRTKDGAFGGSLCDPGDWNGDGTPDLAVGVATDATGGTQAGAAFVYSGKDWSVLDKIAGKAANFRFGWRISSLGDLDGDKRHEILIGSQYFNYNVFAKDYAEVWSPAKKSFYSDTHCVSLGALGAQRLSLNAGIANAGNAYLVLGSLSGIKPGLRVGNLTLPLQPDPYFFFSASAANSAVLPGSLGILDAKGQGSCRFQAVPGLPKVLAGLRADHAFLVFGKHGFTMTSNWVPLLFEK